MKKFGKARSRRAMDAYQRALDADPLADPRTVEVQSTPVRWVRWVASATLILLGLAFARA